MVEETGLAPAAHCLQGSIAPVEHAPPLVIPGKMARRPGAAPGKVGFGDPPALLARGVSFPER